MSSARVEADFADLLDRLADRAGSGAPRRHHVVVRPARAASYDDWPGWVPAHVVEALVARGIERPWTHQSATADAAWSGRNVVVSTGTASGKSLGYLLPGLSAIESARGGKGQRGATVLYVSPTKALAADQAAAIDELGLPVRVSTHDGDSGPDQRAWTREHAEWVLTNPDMLHHSMLPTHEAWVPFWRSLRFVVVDELHQYRGIFGAHVAHVLHRLRRICAKYGSSPTFILASATIAGPEHTAARLVGAPCVAVSDDGSPRGEVTLGLWEPPLISRDGENSAPVRRNAGVEAADLLTDLVIAGHRTLAFGRSRRGVETIARRSRDLLLDVDPALADRVAAYRGGYLPEERRALETALRSGRLVGLAATNALELGIDVSGLDAVVMAGFPGTRGAFWQQVGRAGRGAQNALGVMIARDDPLDTYLVNHPGALLDAPVEASVFDPDNPHILGPHLCAAAKEIPLTADELPSFGGSARAVADELVEVGLLRRRPTGWFWTHQQRPSDLADLRSGGGQPLRLVEEGTGRVLGTTDEGSAHVHAHEGAVYVHQGETWVVSELDLEEHVATVHRDDPGYSTYAREVTDIAILEEERRVSSTYAQLSFGTVRVTHQVVGYLKREVPSGTILGQVPLDLPERVLETRAVWWTIADEHLRGIDPEALPGAAHAAEHASIGLLPLFATCDRWDIGGVSTARHADTGELTVFVHDAHPGGAGFSERGFEAARAWLQATRDAITECECEDGCPSCVQSPKCGNGNNPLDKAGAIALLGIVLEGLA